MLQDFLIENRDELIARARAKVSARTSPPPTDESLNNGVPIFLEELIETLGQPERTSTPELRTRAAAHGGALSRMGYTVGQVVHDYGDVCQAITELATETKAQISNEDFHTLNRCLDDAMAFAVTEFNVEKDQASAKDANERLGFFAHELRNLLATASLSFEILRKGSVGIGGSTGGVLQRALQSLRVLVDRSLSEVLLETGITHRKPLLVRVFVAEVETTAALEAAERGHRLTVTGPLERDLTIDVDRHILASVIFNLLQNAFKFSRPASNIILRAYCTPHHVLLEVEDECGGLPSDDHEGMFVPFERRSANRTGMGLGLSISREGARANGGELTVRNIPGRGCVFTVELPRSAPMAEPAT